MENKGGVPQNTRRITVVAVMTALIFVITWLIKFPVPGTGGAYLNFGDIVIYMCAYILGGPLTAIAAAVGSCFADLAVGAAVYALPTLVIKGVMGLIAGLIMRKRGFGFYLLGAVCAGAIMVGGYAAFEFFAFDQMYMVASLPFNFIQYGAAVAVAMIFYTVVENISKYFGFIPIPYKKR